jgi:myo-inositol-1-phosphate synthase
MEGIGFGGVPLNLELRLSVEDSPNSGGVVIDAVRFCKLARIRGDGGALLPVSAYCMKHPPIQMPDSEARNCMERYLEGALTLTQINQAIRNGGNGQDAKEKVTAIG